MILEYTIGTHLVAVPPLSRRIVGYRVVSHAGVSDRFV